MPVIEVAFLNGKQQPTVERADADFNTLGIQFRGYFDFGVTKAEGIPYLVMEFLRGRVLADVLAKGPLRSSRVATIGSQVLSALAEAHACGVIHRDLKADNIMLEPIRDGDDYAKLIDFGIARLADTDDRIDRVHLDRLLRCNHCRDRNGSICCHVIGTEDVDLIR